MFLSLTPLHSSKPFTPQNLRTLVLVVGTHPNPDFTSGNTVFGSIRYVSRYGEWPSTGGDPECLNNEPLCLAHRLPFSSALYFAADDETLPREWLGRHFWPQKQNPGLYT